MLYFPYMSIKGIVITGVLLLSITLSSAHVHHADEAAMEHSSCSVCHYQGTLSDMRYSVEVKAPLIHMHSFSSISFISYYFKSNNITESRAPPFIS